MESLKNFHDKRQHPIAKLIVNSLLHISNKQITFMRVPVLIHVGIQDNKLADEGAKAAFKMFPLPLCPARRTINHQFKERSETSSWKNSWKFNLQTNLELYTETQTLHFWNH